MLREYGLAPRAMAELKLRELVAICDDMKRRREEAANRG